MVFWNKELLFCDINPTCYAISVKKENLTNDNITQQFYEVPRGHKFDVLCRILDISPDFY